MAKNIEPKLKKIGEYLKLDRGVKFVIPQYQRAYSWGISQCDKLWQDIVSFAEDKSSDSHFFGTIIISCKENDTQYELIDGQQRTTTFLLLLKALLIRINTAIENTIDDVDSEMLCRGLQASRTKIMTILYRVTGEEVSYRPNPEKDAAIYQKANILENHSINESYKEELAKILKAADLASAEAEVYKIKFKQKDNKYTNFFRNFKFFCNKVDELKSESVLNNIAKVFLGSSEDSACEIIEIKSWHVDQAIKMFNSLNSAGLPLFDSDIISAELYSAADRRKESDTFKDLWEKFKAATDELESMGITKINSVLLQYMYYVRAVKGETISTNGNINVTTPGLKRYFTEENKDAIADPVRMSGDLLKLAKIWKNVAEHPLQKLLLKFNENSKLFLASYFYRLDEDNITEEMLQPIFECMLRLFAILELVESGYSSKYFKTFLFGEQVKFVDASITDDEIKADFDKHISGNWTRKELKDALLEYDGNALVYLNEYLFAREKGVAFALESPYDIEHIMPYSGHNVSQIRADADIADEEEFYSVVNNLGNKILLESKINRGIGNEWFRTKVSTTLKDKTGYQDSKYPIAKALVAEYKDTGRPFWKKDDIAAATEKASERIVKFIFGE
ncbi:MAG: DUF262 domain-containing protein [Ruminococcaceae bacterium]|nr:DUF262 domain-containing protein [Oscillospiraceae bacterium]